MDTIVLRAGTVILVDGVEHRTVGESVVVPVEPAETKKDAPADEEPHTKRTKTRKK